MLDRLLFARDFSKTFALFMVDRLLDIERPQQGSPWCCSSLQVLKNDLNIPCDQLQFPQ